MDIKAILTIQLENGKLIRKLWGKYLTADQRVLVMKLIDNHCKQSLLLREYNPIKGNQILCNQN